MATNRLRTKVRLVKCPKCSKILPEPEHVPLYTCGGCGTILRAKYYIDENRGTTLDSHQNNTKESGDVGQRSSSDGGLLSDQNEGKDENATRITSPSSESVYPSNTNKETDSKPDIPILTDCVLNPKEDSLKYQNSTNDASDNQNHVGDVNSVREASDDQNHVGDVNSVREASDDQNHVGDVNSVREASDDQNHVGDVNSVREASDDQNHVGDVNSVREASDDQNHVGDVNSVREASDDQNHVGDVNSVREASDDQNHVGDVNSVRETSDDQNHVGDVSSAREASFSNEYLVSNESDHCVPGDLQDPGEGKLSDENISVEEISHRDMEKIANLAKKESRGKKILDDSINHVGEQLGSINLNEASSSMEMIQEGRNDISTARTEANSGAFRDRGEMALPSVSRSVKVIPRSLTKGSLAYDASVSSFDGNDDQITEQQENLRSSVFPHKHKRYSQIRKESVEENTISLRNSMMRQNRERFLHRGPQYRSSELVYETGSSSSYLRDNLPVQKMHNHRHPYRHEDSEPWVRNMEYWRASDAMWRENEYIPTYCNNHATSSEIYRRRRAENRSFSGNLPRVNYFGEMRDPIRWSAQLRGPPQPEQAFSWDPYDSSYPTSPQNFTESSGPYPWLPYDIAASVADEHQRRRHEIMRRSYLREKRQAMKRHFRSLAGGAPFVTCYFCFRVVRLPEDFLLLRKRRADIHRVKCGVCSNILEYSVEDGSCLIPCMLNPDYGASEGGEINDGRNNSANVRPRNSPNDTQRTEGAHDVGSRSMKITWKTPSRRSKSPLHRLMGYSSPYDIFNAEEGKGADW